MFYFFKKNRLKSNQGGSTKAEPSFKVLLLRKRVLEVLVSFSSNKVAAGSGIVVAVTDGIAKIIGLSAVKAGELISFSNNIQGMVLNLEKHEVRAVIFGNDSGVVEGSTCLRTFNIISIPVSDSFLGELLTA